MTSFNFDEVFEEAEEEGFGPSGDLTPGKYEAKIVHASFGDSKAGDPKLGFMFKAAPDSEDAEGNDVSGDTIWLNLTFSAKGGKYAARDAQALGLTSAMLNNDPEAAVLTTVGQVWKIDVVASDDGKWTNVRLKKRLDTPAEDTKPKPKPKAEKPAPAPSAEEPEPESTELEGQESFADVDEGDPWNI